MHPSTATSATSVTRLDAFDPQALVLALQEGFLEHVQLEKGRFGGQIVHSVSPQCRTDWGQYNLALLAQGDLSPEWVSVGIFLHGHGVWRVQGQALRNGDLVVYAPAAAVSRAGARRSRPGPCADPELEVCAAAFARPPTAPAAAG